MQPLGDYLKKLLYQYDCVVVPTLGAFLTHSVSASFSEATGQFLPPRRKVAFNGALLLDDGILLNYVMLHEGITREEALRGITAFVTGLTREVRQQGSFAIDGLGLFSYNAEDSLQFDPELRHNFLSSTYGMQPLALPGRVVHLARPVPMAGPVFAVEVPGQLSRTTALTIDHSANMAPAVADDDTTRLTLPVRRVAWRRVAAALLVGTLGLVSYATVVSPGESFQSSLNPATLLRWPLVSPERSAVPVAPFVAVPAGKPTAVLMPVDLVSPSRNQDAGRTKVAIAARITAAVVSVTPSVPAAPARVAAVRVRTPFTVVAGSFASRRNAVRFQKRLTKAGYADAYIVGGRGLIKVAAVGTASLSEAEASVDPLRALTGITPWIMRNR